MKPILSIVPGSGQDPQPSPFVNSGHMKTPKTICELGDEVIYAGEPISRLALIEQLVEQGARLIGFGRNRRLFIQGRDVPHEYVGLPGLKVAAKLIAERPVDHADTSLSPVMSFKELPQGELSWGQFYDFMNLLIQSAEFAGHPLYVNLGDGSDPDKDRIIDGVSLCEYGVRVGYMEGNRGTSLMAMGGEDSYAIVDAQGITGLEDDYGTHFPFRIHW